MGSVTRLKEYVLDIIPEILNGAVPPCLMHRYKAKFPKDATAGYFDLFGTSDITVAKLKAETLIHSVSECATGRAQEIFQS